MANVDFVLVTLQIISTVSQSLTRHRGTATSTNCTAGFCSKLLKTALQIATPVLFRFLQLLPGNNLSDTKGQLPQQPAAHKVALVACFCVQAARQMKFRQSELCIVSWVGFLSVPEELALAWASRPHLRPPSPLPLRHHC